VTGYVHSDEPQKERHAPFRVEVHPERDVVRVAPVGELDIATAPTLEEQLQELRTSGFDHLVVDLRQVAFLDSSGIRVLVEEHGFAGANDREFSVISGPPAVQRTLEVCGLLELLSVRPA
jgi:anti-sigma B factor antagonist